MRTIPLVTTALLAALCFPMTVGATARGPIDCTVKAISEKDRARLGASMTRDGDASDAISSAHKFISEASLSCIKANKWTAAQTESAITWAQYSLMAEDLQRQSGMSVADLAIVRAYVVEDMKRLENLQRFTAAQQTQLLDELRKRGAQLRGNADDAGRQIAVVMLVCMMRMQEVEFARL